MVDKNKAVICCLLATSAVMLAEKKKRKRKMWSRKWFLKRNIACDAHLVNELLETDMPWVDAIMVSAGKPRILWDSLSELRSSVYERRLGRTVLRPVKTAQFSQFFPSSITSHSKIAQFNWKCTVRLTIGDSSSVEYVCVVPFATLSPGDNTIEPPKCIFFGTGPVV